MEGLPLDAISDPRGAASTTLGFFAVVGLSFAFGTMYLPVKRHNMGNGKFADLMHKNSWLCVAFVC